MLEFLLGTSIEFKLRFHAKELSWLPLLNLLDVVYKGMYMYVYVGSDVDHGSSTWINLIWMNPMQMYQFILTVVKIVVLGFLQKLIAQKILGRWNSRPPCHHKSCHRACGSVAI